MDIIQISAILLGISCILFIISCIFASLSKNEDDVFATLLAITFLLTILCAIVGFALLAGSIWENPKDRIEAIVMVIFTALFLIYALCTPINKECMHGSVYIPENKIHVIIRIILLIIFIVIDVLVFHL